MIAGAPSLARWLRTQRTAVGIEPFLEQYVDRSAYRYYGSGKAALGDGMRAILKGGVAGSQSQRGERVRTAQSRGREQEQEHHPKNIVLPAYLPDAVVEPFLECGLEARYYAIKPDLGPDMSTLADRVDEHTAAVMAVNYFGFPQPRFDRLVELTRTRGCALIEDNAHSPLSVADGHLLGTRGDIGVTSLWKLFPIPNGAVLYLQNEALAGVPTPSSGIADGFGRADCRYTLTALTAALTNSHPALHRSAQRAVSMTNGAVSDPTTRYEAAKSQMTQLSAQVVNAIDPEAVRRCRRANYRAWQTGLATRDDLSPIYETLSPGLCPQVFPVVAEAPEAFLSELKAQGVGGTYTWPRLRPEIRTDRTYETATDLSERLVLLPVHQDIPTDRLERVASQLSRA